MKHSNQKISHKPGKVKKRITWDDLVGIADYKGPKKSIREIQLESARAKMK